MAEVPLKRPIFIRVWVEGKKKLLVIRAKKRNFGTTNRGTHLDGIFPLPPLLFWGENERGEENVFRERERGRKKEERVRSNLLFPSWRKKEKFGSFRGKVVSRTLDIICDYFVCIKHFNE